MSGDAWIQSSFSHPLSLESSLILFFHLNLEFPIPVAARSKMLVCGRSLAGIAGLTPPGSMDVCLLWLLCVVRCGSLRRADHSYRGMLCVWVCVITKPRQISRPRPIGSVEPWKNYEGLFRSSFSSSHKNFVRNSLFSRAHNVPRLSRKSVIVYSK